MDLIFAGSRETLADSPEQEDPGRVRRGRGVGQKRLFFGGKAELRHFGLVRAGRGAQVGQELRTWAHASLCV